MILIYTILQEFVNTMRGVSGHVGKIIVYKSGKVKFKIGDCLYDVCYIIVILNVVRLVNETLFFSLLLFFHTLDYCC